MLSPLQAYIKINTELLAYSPSGLLKNLIVRMKLFFDNNLIKLSDYQLVFKRLLQKNTQTNELISIYIPDFTFE